MRFRVATSAVCVALLASGTASAQTQTWKESYRQVVPSSNIEGLSAQGLFGERISPTTGELSFYATDVSMPGNDGLEVAFHRRLLPNDPTDVRVWEIDLPHLEGVYPAGIGWIRKALGGTPLGRCSGGKLAPPLATGGSVGTGATTSSWDANEYWNGDFLSLPGSGPEELLRSVAGGAKLPTDGATYLWLTQSGWRFSCLTTLQNGSGEGFLGVSPQGMRYYFDWLVTQAEETLTRPGGTGPLSPQSTPQSAWQPFGPVSAGDYLSRERVLIYVSRVEDRFGNHVDYNYGTNGLTSIVASDGRTLTVGRDGTGALASVTANGRSWTYASAGGVYTVGLPDGSNWQYTLGALQTQFSYNGDSDGSLIQAQQQCDAPPQPIGAGTLYTGTIKHPSGALGTFTVRPTRHGRSYVPRNCPGFVTQDGRYFAYAFRPYVFDVRSLVSLQVSGPGLNRPGFSRQSRPPKV